MDHTDYGALLRVWHEAVGSATGVVVHVAGEVDLSTAGRLRDELDTVEARLAAPGPLVIDLTEVTFLASVGLSILVEHDLRCRQTGHEMQVVTGNRTVARTIMMTGLTEALTLFDTLTDAVNATR